jgi:hypothetical protein
MTKRRMGLHRLPHLCFLPLLAAACTAPVQATERVALSVEDLSTHCGATIPGELTVAPDQQLAFKLHAQGVQVYACQNTGAAEATWEFVAPEADLFDRRGRNAGRHTAGPSWQALDGSAAVGKRVASAIVDESSIPWLLMDAASDTDEGIMSRVSCVQRLDTSGGLAPTMGCDAKHLGHEVRVAYSANYAFYTPRELP